jgi:hypothetical protein
LFARAGGEIEGEEEPGRIILNAELKAESGKSRHKAYQFLGPLTASFSRNDDELFKGRVVQAHLS